MKPFLCNRLCIQTVNHVNTIGTHSKVQRRYIHVQRKVNIQTHSSKLKIIAMFGAQVWISVHGCIVPTQNSNPANQYIFMNTNLQLQANHCTQPLLQDIIISICTTQQQQLAVHGQTYAQKLSTISNYIYNCLFKYLRSVGG